MNVLVKYQIKFGCLIVSLLTTKVIDRLCSTQLRPDPVTQGSTFSTLYMGDIKHQSSESYNITQNIDHIELCISVKRPLFLRNSDLNF